MQPRKSPLSLIELLDILIEFSRQAPGTPRYRELETYLLSLDTVSLRRLRESCEGLISASKLYTERVETFEKLFTENQEPLHPSDLYERKKQVARASSLAQGAGKKLKQQARYFIRGR